MNLLKIKDAAAKIGAGKSGVIVVCGPNCSRCKKADAQLFSTPAFQALGIPLVSPVGLPVGVQSSNDTPYVCHVAVSAIGRASKVPGTACVSFKADAKGNYTLIGLTAAIG